MAVYLIESPVEDLEEKLRGSGFEVRRVLVCSSCGVIYDPDYTIDGGFHSHEPE